MFLGMGVQILRGLCVPKFLGFNPAASRISADWPARRGHSGTGHRVAPALPASAARGLVGSASNWHDAGAADHARHHPHAGVHASRRLTVPSELD